MGRRLSSLHSKNWSAERKAKVAEVLTLDYMSSEESDTDENGKGLYKIKTLPWQSQELKKRKKALDKQHKESLPELVRRRLTPKHVGGVSSRSKPEDCPDWACSAI